MIKKNLLALLFILFSITLNASIENNILKGDKIYSSGNNDIFCHNATTGKEIWRFKHSSGRLRFQTSLAIHNGRLLFSDFNGFLYSLNAKTGAVVWKKKHNLGKTLYFNQNCLEGKKLYFTSQNGFIGQLNTKTGNVLRKSKVNAILAHPPLITKNKIIYKLNSNKIVCLRKKTLQKIWIKKLKYLPYVAIKPVANKLIIGCKKKVVCLNKANGRTVWESPIEANYYANIIHKARRLFITTTTKKVYCLNTSTGKKIWSTYLKNRSFGGSGIYKNNLIAADIDANLYAINIYSGRLKWIAPLEMSVTSSIKSRGNRLYFSSGNNCLYAINGDNPSKPYIFRKLLEPISSINNYTITTFKPIYMKSYQLRSAFKVMKPHPLKRSGKIQTWKKQLLISERWKGIHIFDNSNPINPKQLYFLSIPGNMDISVFKGILYADSAMDLLAIRLPENGRKPFLTKRLKNSLPFSPKLLLDLEIMPFQNRRSNSSTKIKKIDPKKGIVVSWKKTIRLRAWVRNPYVKYSESGGRGNSSGKGGSMSRFTINKQNLYIVNNNALATFNLDNPSHPYKIGSAIVGREIETIFPYKNYLFIGSRQAIYIYSIKDNPLKPKLVSKLRHKYSYDPIIVSGNYAYVTLRSGSGRGSLRVIDISDIKNPKEIKNYPIDQPWGLAIDNNFMFICTNSWGIKVFDVKSLHNKNSRRPKRIGMIYTGRAFDIIAHKGRIIIATQTQILQYAYTRQNKFKKLSQIAVVP